MILVDTSVWIDHLRQDDAHLRDLLLDGVVLGHPLVVEELALGTLGRRAETLGLLAQLEQAPVLTHAELLSFIEAQQLWGRGLSTIDAHLLGAARIASARLWTRDRRLAEAAVALGVAHSTVT